VRIVLHQRYGRAALIVNVGRAALAQRLLKPLDSGAHQFESAVGAKPPCLPQPDRVLMKRWSSHGCAIVMLASLVHEPAAIHTLAFVLAFLCAIVDAGQARGSGFENVFHFTLSGQLIQARSSSASRVIAIFASFAAADFNFLEFFPAFCYGSTPRNGLKPFCSG